MALVGIILTYGRYVDEHYRVTPQNHYEERFRALQKIVSEHKDAATFEDFVTRVRIKAETDNYYFWGNKLTVGARYTKSFPVLVGCIMKRNHACKLSLIGLQPS